MNFTGFTHLNRTALLGLSLILMPLSAPQAFAEDILAIATPPETPAEINNFKLSEDLLVRIEKIHNALEKMQFSPTAEEGQVAEPSMDSMIASLETRPQVMALIKAENLTAREYLLGYFAMMSALAAADADEEEMLIDEVEDINPEHLEFGKKYGDRIRDLIGE